MQRFISGKWTVCENKVFSELTKHLVCFLVNKNQGLLLLVYNLFFSLVSQLYFFEVI